MVHGHHPHGHNLRLLQTMLMDQVLRTAGTLSLALLLLAAVCAGILVFKP